MPNGTICQLVKLHLVVGEQVASLTVENVTCPDEQVKKVDHIDVVVRDLEATPVFTSPLAGECTSPKETVHFYDPTCTQPSILRRITVTGTIHKQVYYVNRNDDVRHMPEDIPFTRTINISPPITVLNPNNVEIDFRNVDIDLSSDLMGHNKIRQVATVSFLIKVMETRQLWAILCIPPGPNGPVLGIEEETFEEWIGDCPALWDCVNVCPKPEGRTGLAAALGCCPTLPASLVRTVADIVGGTTYELGFWIRSLKISAPVCEFTVVAQQMFLDAAGNVLSTAQETITANQLNATYRPFRFTGTAPEGTASVMISFIFTPQPWNGCAALIDDVTFGPV